MARLGIRTFLVLYVPSVLDPPATAAQMDDAVREVFNRFKRQDAAIAATQTEDGPSSTSGRLRSLVWLALALKDLPWRGLLFVMGAIFAFLGHLLPAELNTFLRQILLLR